jgi:CheY-like chemotaxis protein
MSRALRVLVVDDDVDSCDLIELVLQSHNIETQSAFSVTQALDKFIDFQPDVVVSDIAMPEEDGYSLLRKIRVLEAMQGRIVHAIAITALVDEKLTALSSGFQKFLPKPFDLDELLVAILSLVGKHRLPVCLIG